MGWTRSTSVSRGKERCSMLEAEFERAIVEMAHLFGWRVASFRPAMSSKGWATPVKFDGAGFPDLTLVHPDGFVVFAEIKSQSGKLSPGQVEWAETFARSSDRFGTTAVRYRVWRPSDGDAIARLLSFGRVTEWAP